jgi:2-amino-4-hydroxy-6-hydroxymethyldihydropteridine diphosphokinase
MYYLCSIGSNIDPEDNVGRVITELAARFDSVTFSPFIYTAPVGMCSQRQFINALFYLHCELTERSLKQLFNQLETEHGRDRGDSLSSVKDRPLDIDILAVSSSLDFPLPKESYLQPLATALLGSESLPPSVMVAKVTIGRLQLGDRTATIHFNSATGHIVVVD